jgi:alpha-beta hydrolase superfamily lysophospholipase
MAVPTAAGKSTTKSTSRQARPSRPAELTSWAASDGMPLQIRHWVTTGTPWATVLFVHGIGEHSGRYDRVGRLMSRVGLDVRAYDLRGHGISGGRRAYIRSWEEYLDDLEIVLLHLRGTGVPLAVVGHSMGALIALSYACGGRPLPDLLVLSGTPLEMKVPIWQRAMALSLAHTAPKVMFRNPIKGDQLSTDPRVGKAYESDPLVNTRTTARLAHELFTASRRVRDQLDELTVPTLVLHGGADTVVPPEASAPLAVLARVERRVLPNMRHEILNEREGPEVVGTMVRWMREQVAIRRRMSAL